MIYEKNKFLALKIKLGDDLALSILEKGLAENFDQTNASANFYWAVAAETAQKGIWCRPRVW